MNEFPTLVYRTPGPHRLNGTETYDYHPAVDQAALDALLKDGWHETLADHKAHRKAAK